MARISVEDCLEKLPNRFALVLLASNRTKQLLKGSNPRVQADNKEIVLALREVAAGKVTLIKSLQEPSKGTPKALPTKEKKS